MGASASSMQPGTSGSGRPGVTEMLHGLLHPGTARIGEGEADSTGSGAPPCVASPRTRPVGQRWAGGGPAGRGGR